MPANAGKILLTFGNDGSLDISFPNLGSITPAMIEKNLPKLFRALAMARNAEQRSLKSKEANNG